MQNKNKVPVPPPVGEGEEKAKVTMPPLPESPSAETNSVLSSESGVISDKQAVDQNGGTPPPPINNNSGNGNNNFHSTPSNIDNSGPKKTIWIIGGIIVLLIIGVVLFFFLNKPGLKLEGGGNIKIDANGTGGRIIGLRVGKNKNYRDDDEKEVVETNNITNKACQSQYDKLLEINGFDFDKYCTSQSVRSGNYDNKNIPQKKKNLVLIFDASGSMAAKISGKRKIDIAKEAAWKFIDQTSNEKDFSLSIVVYGHKGSNSASQKTLSCNGIEEIYYLGPVDATIAKSKLNKFDATGWTPIAGSLKKAQEILSKHPDDENFILLVSDGKEMCNGNPVATIKEIKDSGLNVKADVIGFDVGGADEAQLKAIAEAGDGDYFSVSSAVDLENAFAKHKEMLNKANYKIGRTIESLYDISFIVHTYGQCRTMLEKEKIAMMVDIYGNKLVTQKCAKSAESTYVSRYNSIKSNLKNIYEQGYNTFVQSAKK